MSCRTANVSSLTIAIVGLLLLSCTNIEAFVVPVNKNNAYTASTSSRMMASLAPNDDSFMLNREQVKPLIRIGKDPTKEKIINGFGLWAMVVSLVTGPIWLASMSILRMINNKFENWDPHRAIYDNTGKLWAKAWLTLTMSYPTFSGSVELLKKDNHQGPCLYVANHASWLDIPVLCTILDPVFKFISKAELKKVPCIGQQLEGGNHILIDRTDRRSQLRTFKEGCAWLKRGVPLMAFPEGQRSLDGRLMDFKGGIFSMAVREKVPIIPLSVSHTHAVMPSNALFPVQAGRGKLHVHVHEPISTEDKTEEELVELVRRAMLSKLPEEQHPVKPEIEVENTEIIEIVDEKDGTNVIKPEQMA